MKISPDEAWHIIEVMRAEKRYLKECLVCQGIFNRLCRYIETGPLVNLSEHKPTEREPGYILDCPNCGDKLVAGYTAKTLEELLQRERPDFWFCHHCQLEYKETKTGKLKRSVLKLGRTDMQEANQKRR